MKISDCMRVFDGIITDLHGLFDKDVRDAQLLNSMGKQTSFEQNFQELEDDEPVTLIEVERLSPTTARVNGSNFYGSEKSMKWFLEGLE